jgi:excisionase family DNA binding protein
MPPRTARRNLATIQQAAEHLSVNERTVRRRIADGTLTGYRVGPRLVRVDLDEVDRELRAIPTGSDAA